MWKEHYSRVFRLKERIKRDRRIVKAYAINHSIPAEGYTDDVYSCIQSLHHLKDWLVSDGVISSSEANTFIDENFELQICQDICIGTKHLTPKYKEKDMFFDVKVRPVVRTSKGSFDDVEFCHIVYYEGFHYDAIDLIEKSLNLWEEFLKIKGATLN